jgi:hypothetical protein
VDTEEEVKQYLKKICEQEFADTDDPLKDYTYRSFTSKSAGKNKRRKRLTEIELIGIGRGRFISLTNGRFPKKKKVRMDCIAEEALGNNCPPNIHSLDHFLNLLRQRDKKPKYRSRG